MQLFHIKEYRYLIQLRRKYSWQTFRKIAKVVPGTYSETFAKEIYTSVFDSSINLGREYHKFYKEEYDTINQFLFWRYGISEETQGQLGPIRKGFLVIFEYPWQIEDEEILKESISQLFQELDGQNENKN